jgi:prepilin-type processing-associated H-X9-DG protein
MFTGTVLSVTVRDGEGIHKQLGRFLALLGGGPDSVRTIRLGQSEIRYAVASASKGAISPAYMIRGNRLYVAAWPQVLQSLLAMDPKDKLIEAAGFKEMRQTLGPPGQFLEYVNPRELLRTLYGGLMLASSALSSLAAQDGLDLSPELLPALHHLSRLVSPAVVSMRIDEDGWWSDSYGPTGGLANALTVPSLSVAVTVAVPAIARAREIARHTISATRLRNLHTAITMYEARHGKPPESLEDLVRGGMIQPASLSRPGGHVKPTFQNGRLRGPLYYTYQAPPVLTSKLENPRDTVLAYSLAALHGQSEADVLFADGRVEQMPWPHLRKLLAGQNDQP